MAKFEAMPAGDARAKVPAHEQVYRDLRLQVLSGDLAPGQAVTIQGLTDALGAGMTPVREAIRRLISDGALVFQGNRRVSVPVLSAEDIEQLVFLRKSIEPDLAARAAAQAGRADVEVLAAVDARLDRAILSGDVSSYLICNHEFHSRLYRMARAPILAETAERLWLRFGPSLRVVCGRFGTQNLPDRHKDILEALKCGNRSAAAAAMEADVTQGMDQIAQVLTAPARTG